MDVCSRAVEAGMCAAYCDVCNLYFTDLKKTIRAFTYVLGTLLAGTCSRNTLFLVV